MKGRRWVAGMAAVLAAALLLATRVPAREGFLGYVAIGAAIATGLLGLLVAVRPTWRWAMPLALASGVIVLAVPPSPRAAVPGLPVLVVLPTLIYFHLLYPMEADQAPNVGRQPSRFLASILRLGPFLAGVAFVTAFPWIARRLLPDRLGAVHELAGPLAAIVAAGLVTTVLAILALARAASRARRGPPPEATTPHDGVPASEGAP